jgi:guanylate kinase
MNQENKKGRLFVMSGPSGTGKGTVCKELIKREDIYLSVSNTTRGIGKDEQEGVTYYYVSREEFERMIENGEMLEYAEYNGNYYGTNKKRVAQALESGRNVLLEIEPQGALQVKKIFPEAVLIFVLPPSMEELKKRLVERGRESIDVINDRISAAQWEITQKDKYDYEVINDDLETCIREVCEIIRKSCDKQ